MGNRETRLFKLFGLLAAIYMLLILVAGILLYASAAFYQRLRKEIGYHGEARFPAVVHREEAVTTMEKARTRDVTKDIAIPYLTSPALKAHAMGGPSMPKTSPTAVKVALTRKLIREAWLTLLVQDVPKVTQQVRQVAEEFEGYVAESSQTRKPDGSWALF